MNVQHNEDLSRVMNNIRIELYETGFADLDSEWRQQDVCSPFSRLYYVISGKGYLRIHGGDGREELHELTPGYLYLIPNGFPMIIFVRTGWKKFTSILMCCFRTGWSCSAAVKLIISYP